jgi:two-component system chemotaxis response regulator CheY
MGATAFDKLKVVVVDDNDHMRSLLHSMLYAFGIRTIIGSADGKSGFVTVQSVKPDFVLTDFSMQPVNGAEFVRMIRALPEPMAYLPIIMITGHGERQYIERARDAGVTELLTKPVTARDLYIRIMDVVEKPRKFIKSPSFIGPDRRRRTLKEGLYPKRRKSDFEDEMEFR